MASLGSDVISGAAPVTLPTMLQMAKAIMEGTPLTLGVSPIQVLTSELGEQVVSIVPDGGSSEILSGDQYIVSEVLNGAVTKMRQLEDNLETHKVAVSRPIRPINMIFLIPVTDIGWGVNW